MTATAGAFRLRAEGEAFEGERSVRRKAWDEAIPREWH